MHKPSITFGSSPKQLAALLASVGMLAALPAEATLVVNNLMASASASAGGNPAVTDGIYSSSTSTSAFAPASSGSSSGSGRSFGLVGGPYGAGGDGSGVFDSSGHFVRQWTITNNDAVAASYAFNFFIYYGSMTVNDGGYGGTGSAEYQAMITRDGGTALWSSTAKLQNDGTLTQTGTLLSGASLSGGGGSWYYSWGGTNIMIDLGILNPGQSTTVAYDLVGHAIGNYGSGNCGGQNGYGYGYGGVVSTFAVVSEGCTGQSRAFLGDPDQLSSTPLPNNGNFNLLATNVPEPASLSLLGLGLAAFGVPWRRRRQ